MKWFYANLKINEIISVTNPLWFTITYLNHLKKNAWIHGKIKPVALAFILSYFMEKNLRRNLSGIKVYLPKSNKRIQKSPKNRESF